MITSSIEITENEYLIKLNRSKFNLSFIRSLLKIVEVSDRSDNELYEKDLENGAIENTPFYSRIEEK